MELDILKLKKDLYWLGALDSKLRIFDIIMETEFGTTYNSYLLKGSEKIVLFETVKEKYFDQYIKKLKTVTDLEKIDYIVVSHTEPDHAGSIEKLLEIAPQIKIIASERAIEFLRDIVNKEFNYIIANSGDQITLGNKTLEFYLVPFLHWPDTIYTHIKEDNILVTCDSFGAHYSFDDILYSKIPAEKKEDYLSALKYYYLAIFGPFKPYVIEALSKIETIYPKIEMILTGHGPVLDKNPQEIMEKYRLWSTPVEKTDDIEIVIPYVTAYGYTEILADEIEKGIKKYDHEIKVQKYNLNIGNYNALKPEILKQMINADGILFGTSTINGDALSIILDLTLNMNPIDYAGKYASAFGSYGWSGEGVDNIVSRLDQLRMKVFDGYRIKFKPNEEKKNGAFEFGYTFAKYLKEKLEPKRVEEKLEDIAFEDEGYNKWKCTVCGQVYEGVIPPKICPACGVGKEYFIGIRNEIIDENQYNGSICIIGGGIAGISAAQSIRERSKNAKILLIEGEKSLPYYRTLLSDYLYKELKDEKFYLKPLDYFEREKIELLIGTKVSNIDYKNTKICMEDGEERHYDKLIIATGACSYVPKNFSLDTNGIFVLRNKKDADEIKEYAKNCKNAVIIGGGVLGLEAAHAMYKLGLNVTVVEIMQRLLPRQLDEMSSRILEKKIVEKGIKILKNTVVQSYLENDKIEKILLDNNREIMADIVIVSAGISPNKQLANIIELKTNRGIIVNEKMETSIEDIYACGDVAEFNSKITGLWDVSIEQGKVAGANAVGDKIEYKEKVQPLTFEGFETQLLSIGNVNEEKENIEVLTELDLESCNYKKMYFNLEKIEGGILLGDISKGGILMKAVGKQMLKKEILKKIYE